LIGVTWSQVGGGSRYVAGVAEIRDRVLDLAGHPAVVVGHVHPGIEAEPGGELDRLVDPVHRPAGYAARGQPAYPLVGSGRPQRRVEPSRERVPVRDAAGVRAEPRVGREIGYAQLCAERGELPVVADREDGDDVHEGDPDLRRLPAGLPRDAHQAADRLHQHVVPGQPGVGAATEPGDRAVHEARVCP
jgi:hypothetical protein